jgi:hypothetical protein
LAVASGFIDDPLRRLAREAGVHELIFKASGMDNLCAAIERLLDGVSSANPA